MIYQLPFTNYELFCRAIMSQPGDAGIAETWMLRALELAEKARAEGEVPVGALVVQGGEVIGEGWNRPISTSDPTAHAEIVALRDAATRVANYRLLNATLIVTLEPCLMCAGAMVHARIERLVFGAYDPKRGAVNSTLHAFDKDGLNHRVEVRGGVMEDDCARLLRSFFQEKRNRPDIKNGH